MVAEGIEERAEDFTKGCHRLSRLRSDATRGRRAARGCRSAARRSRSATRSVSHPAASCTHPASSSPVISLLIGTVSFFSVAERPITWEPGAERSEGGSMDETLRRLTQFSHCAG